MKERRQFDLDIIKLSNKKHYYEFDIDNTFFESFEDSLIEKGKLKVKLSLDKSETMIIADFDINGSVELICDRSLEEFDFPLAISEQLIFKYGNEYEEVSDEIITIPKDSQKLDVSQYIYEFIGLTVPMKKLHPRFVTEEQEDDESDTLLIYSTKGEDESDTESQDTETPDDLWEKLKKLKDNFN